jgi:hypothetical protein
MAGGATACVGHLYLRLVRARLEYVRNFFMVYETRYSLFRSSRSTTYFEGKFGRFLDTIFQNFGPTRSHVRNMERVERYQLSDSSFG